MGFEDIRGQMQLLFKKERDTYADFRRMKEAFRKEEKEKLELIKEKSGLERKCGEAEARGDRFELQI
jgi:hypothetical protein